MSWLAAFSVNLGEVCRATMGEFENPLIEHEYSRMGKLFSRKSIGNFHDFGVLNL